MSVLSVTLCGSGRCGDGKAAEGNSFDEPAMKILKKAKVKRPVAKDPGGPKPVPSRNELP